MCYNIKDKDTNIFDNKCPGFTGCSAVGTFHYIHWSRGDLHHHMQLLGLPSSRNDSFHDTTMHSLPLNVQRTPSNRPFLGTTHNWICSNSISNTDTTQHRLNTINIYAMERKPSSTRGGNFRCTERKNPKNPNCKRERRRTNSTRHAKGGEKRFSFYTFSFFVFCFSFYAQISDF